MEVHDRVRPAQPSAGPRIGGKPKIVLRSDLVAGGSDRGSAPSADADAMEAPRRAGPSRRSLIKGAVAAGIGAWTAPVIIDSLASPAAAGTVSGCFQVFQTVGPQSFFPARPGEWGTWSDGPGSAAFDGLPCPPGGPGGCGPVTATTFLFRDSIPAPAPDVNFGSTTPVTVVVPSGCRIVGLGVSLQPLSTLTPNVPPVCSSTTVDISLTTVARFTCTGITTSTVTITPNGVSPSNPVNRGVWDSITTTGDGRSSIVLQIQCP